MGVAQASPTCTLAAIVDPAPAAAEIAAKAGVPLYRSLDELFGNDRPDGVVLATPNQLHVEHALQCIEAGVPMLLEKPIAPTVAEAERLVAVADRASAPASSSATIARTARSWRRRSRSSTTACWAGWSP